jgi:hypothetical protein
VFSEPQRRLVDIVSFLRPLQHKDIGKGAIGYTSQVVGCPGLPYAHDLCPWVQCIIFNMLLSAHKLCNTLTVQQAAYLSILSFCILRVLGKVQSVVLFWFTVLPLDMEYIKAADRLPIKLLP